MAKDKDKLTHELRTVLKEYFELYDARRYGPVMEQIKRVFEQNGYTVVNGQKAQTVCPVPEHLDN